MADTKIDTIVVDKLLFKPEVGESADKYPCWKLRQEMSKDAFDVLPRVEEKSEIRILDGTWIMPRIEKSKVKGRQSMKTNLSFTPHINKLFKQLHDLTSNNLSGDITVIDMLLNSPDLKYVDKQTLLQRVGTSTVAHLISATTRATITPFLWNKLLDEEVLFLKSENGQTVASQLVISIFLTDFITQLKTRNFDLYIKVLTSPIQYGHSNLIAHYLASRGLETTFSLDILKLRDESEKPVAYYTASMGIDPKNEEIYAMQDTMGISVACKLAPFFAKAPTFVERVCKGRNLSILTLTDNHNMVAHILAYSGYVFEPGDEIWGLKNTEGKTVADFYDQHFTPSEEQLSILGYEKYITVRKPKFWEIEGAEAEVLWIEAITTKTDDLPF